MLALPLIIGAFYTIFTFSSAHCNDFACKELKAPVKFESLDTVKKREGNKTSQN